MQLTHLCKTKDGYDVLVDLKTSHAATHFHDAPQLQQLVTEILSNHEAQKSPLCFEVNIGREAGLTELVEVGPTDTVFYAKRVNRDTFTPFVDNKAARPTGNITIDLRKRDDGAYILYTAYFGKITPPMPGDKDNQDPESIPFWTTHALVLGNQEIDKATITQVCPW